MYKYMIILLIWNIVVMTVFGFDKLMAKTKGRRIRETTLLLCAFFFGGLGAMFGMVLFNHKTSKTKFRLLVPLAFIAGIAVLYRLKGYI